MINTLVWLGIILIGLCLGGIAFCSLAEAAFLGLTPAHRRRLSESAHPHAHYILRLLSEASYLSALIVGMNLFVIIISTIMTLIVKYRLQHGSDWLHEGLHLGMILFIMVFAELTPKTYGGLYPERLAMKLAPFVWALVRAFGPLVFVLTYLARPFTRLVGSQAQARQLMTVDEIRAAAYLIEEDGLVDAEEAQMLDSVIDLGQTEAREIMVPRVDIVAVEENSSIREFATIASRSGFSRIPIYQENLDHITGIVYVTDVLRRLAEGETTITLRDLMRPPFYVPGSKRIDDLLREMREKRVHIAIVIDEFGGTDGLITIEDILEELVGEIKDEHDAPTEEITQLGESEIIVEGKTRIEEINERLGCDLPEGQYDTIAGLLAQQAGHIPLEGETFHINGWQFIVEESDGQHVERVRLIKGVNREDGDD